MIINLKNIYIYTKHAIFKQNKSVQETNT